MKISKQARHEAKQLFRACLLNGRLDENRVRQVVAEIVARKPRGSMAILSHFYRLVKMDVHRRTGKVESPAPLDPGLQSNLKNNLAGIYGPGLQISFEQNPALLGGLRVQVGSDVYDGSIEARLAALQETF